MDPSDPPEHVILVEFKEIVTEGGADTTKLPKVVEQEFKSVTVTEYVPGAKL